MEVKLKLPTSEEEIRQIVLADLKGDQKVQAWITKGLLENFSFFNIKRAMYLSGLYSNNPETIAKTIVEILRTATLYQVKDKEKRMQIEEEYKKAISFIPAWILEISNKRGRQ